MKNPPHREFSRIRKELLNEKKLRSDGNNAFVEKVRKNKIAKLALAISEIKTTSGTEKEHIQIAELESMWEEAYYNLALDTV